MLVQCPEQPEATVPTDMASGTDTQVGAEIAREPQRKTPEIDERPQVPEPQARETAKRGPCLKELLRAVAKFEKPDQSRFLDVFE